MKTNEQVPCVTIKVSGGLGNQLFQYAAARSLAVRRQAGLRLDLSFYARRRHRKFGLADFPIDGTCECTAGVVRWARGLGRMLGFGDRIYKEPDFRFDPAFRDLVAPVVLSGYFQSPRYFEENSEIIRSELTPPASNTPDVIRLAEILNAEDAISLHVRRGDYISNSGNRTIYSECGPEYYQRALQLLPGGGPVVVFSDDISWVKSNLPKSDRYVFAGDYGSGVAREDLWLMTNASHHIIANSTFSWWGAWLSRSAVGLKIAPIRWFENKSLCSKDLVPAHWIRI